MASDLQRAEPGVTNLVSDVIKDAQDLVQQQLALEAALLLALAVGMTLVSGLLLGLMLVHVLHGTLGDQVPLWGCYGIVAGVWFAGSAVLFQATRKKFSTVLPEQSVEALKENVQWIMNPKRSSNGC